MQPELIPGLLVHSQVGAVLVQVHHLRLALLLRPGAIPIDIHLRIPVELLAQVVQFLDAVILHLVIPVIGTAEGRLENFGDMVDISAGQQVFQIRVFLRVVSTGELLDLAGGTFSPFYFHWENSTVYA